MISATALLMLIACAAGTARGQAPQANGEWRSIPLVENGKVADEWKFIGYGDFAVVDGAIKTEPDARGLGLLVYAKEKFGDCRIKVVYRSEGPRSNSGVYVRIDDGVLDAAKPAPAERTPDGKLTAKGEANLKEASEKEQGPWYAVHHGFEVQIVDTADAFHRTGSVYSLAGAEPAPQSSEGSWRTMIITLKGDAIAVAIDGKAVSEFDGDLAAARERKIWHEPKREPKRPRSGYLGLQTHDPGDVVSFKEIAVGPLEGVQK
ncbi:MAG: DUF1080 domain-containing protein [Planctomycetaceae bacterium]|nr:DUF1080 domain-containing protein [Planctomycetaceae bacterium]